MGKSFTTERSMICIKWKATTCVFLPTGKYISWNIFRSQLSLSYKHDGRTAKKCNQIERPRSKQRCFQRKSDKANTLRHNTKKNILLCTLLLKITALFLIITSRSYKRDRDSNSAFVSPRGRYHWVKKLTSSRPFLDAQGCVRAFSPSAFTKYFLRRMMSAVARGVVAGARSHAESLSGVGGHMSRLSTLRKKIAVWRFDRKPDVVKDTVPYWRRIWNTYDIFITTRHLW